jgi:predicted O-linked N-acetylglucosamine transferase (SPINDLY family)
MLAANRIPADRVTFCGSQPLADYLQTIGRVDIVLDTFPFNGHTTTCHCLWMGVPVVTLHGPTPISRVGLSLLTQLHLTDLTASDPARYADIAADLARDADRRRNLRHTLRQRMTSSPLMNNPAVARDLENAFRAVWVQWCSA